MGNIMLQTPLRECNPVASGVSNSGAFGAQLASKGALLKTLQSISLLTFLSVLRWALCVLLKLGITWVKAVGLRRDLSSDVL